MPCSEPQGNRCFLRKRLIAAAPDSAISISLNHRSSRAQTRVSQFERMSFGTSNASLASSPSRHESRWADPAQPPQQPPQPPARRRCPLCSTHSVHTHIVPNLELKQAQSIRPHAKKIERSGCGPSSRSVTLISASSETVIKIIHLERVPKRLLLIPSCLIVL